MTRPRVANPGSDPRSSGRLPAIERGRPRIALLLGTALLGLLGGVALLLAVAIDIPATARADSVTANEAIARRFYAAVNDAVRTGDLSFLDDGAVTTADHMPGASTQCDVRCRVSALHRLDPDLRLRVDDLLVDGDRIVARLSIQTSDRPALLGLPLQGPLAPWSPVDFLRVADGQIVAVQPAAAPPALVEPLARTTLETVPLAPYRLGLVRLTLAPGSAIPALSAKGPVVLLVERGTLVVRVDQQSLVQRVGLTGDPWHEELLAAGAITLAAGDRIALATGAGYSLRSTGDEATSVLSAAALEGDDGPTNRWIRPRSLDEILFNPEGEVVAQSTAPIPWPPGVRSELIAGGIVTTRPSASATLDLTRLTLSSDAALPIHETPGATLLAVRTGSAVVDLIAGDGTIRPVPHALRAQIRSQPGSSSPVATITQGGHAVLQAGATAGVRNVGDEPLILLILDLEPGPGPT